MNLLALSTSGPLPSAALFINGRLAHAALGQGGKTHSETLMPFVEQVLVSAGLAPNLVDTYAVDIGPGSFTGVRIGVCTASALAMAQNRPVVGVSSLRGLAQGLSGSVCALLDCRNGNGYAMLLFDGEVLMPESAVVISEFLKNPPVGTTFVGDGAVLHRQAIQEAVSDARFVDDNTVTAVKIGLCAFGMPTAEREALPLYLRPSQAERLYGGKQL